MANNIDITPGTGKTLKTTDNSSVHTPHHNVDTIAAGANRIGKVTVRNSADAADIDPLAEATFTGRIGEVQATPTSFTVLDRLKALLTGIVLSAGTAIVGAIRDAGPQWTPIQLAANSSDISGSGSDLNVTNTLIDTTKAIIIDDLLITVATDMVVTVKEVSGATLFIFHAKAAAPYFLSMRNGLRASTNKRVAISGSVSGQVYTFASYHEA